MRRLLVTALLVVACKKTEPPGPTRVPVLPDSITSQLGTIGFAMAVDFHSLDVGKLTAMIPDDPPCIHEVLRTTGVGAVTQSGDVWEGYVTGLSQPTLRDCIGKFAPMFGATVSDRGDAFEVDVANKAATFAWHGDVAVITDGSAAPHAGDPPAVILDLLSRVPRNAKGWIVSSGFPDYKIKSAVAWFDADATTWVFTVQAEGSEQGAAAPWVESIVAGFTKAAEAKGVTVDKTWFTTESTPTKAQLVAKIPIAVFQAR